ncbi:MAG: hypothetical protein ACWA5A_05950 [Marinibacterium sp.]
MKLLSAVALLIVFATTSAIADGRYQTVAIDGGIIQTDTKTGQIRMCWTLLVAMNGVKAWPPECTGWYDPATG